MGDAMTGMVPCWTCNGHGLLATNGGQTPENYQPETHECPDCKGNGELPDAVAVASYLEAMVEADEDLSTMDLDYLRRAAEMVRAAPTPPAARPGEDTETWNLGPYKVSVVREDDGRITLLASEGRRIALLASTQFRSAPAARPTGEGAKWAKVVRNFAWRLDAHEQDEVERLAQFLEATPAASPVAGEIDDAMVERARQAFAEAGWCDEMGRTHHDLPATLRAALSAAALPAGEGSQ